MQFSVQYILNSNIYLKRYLRENSNYYKRLIREPSFIYELYNMMRLEYKMTPVDKLKKISDNISMLNTFMDVLK